jgi:sortase A
LSDPAFAEIDGRRSRAGRLRRATRSRGWRALEIALLAAGALLVTAFAGLRLESVASRRIGLAAFEASRAASLPDPTQEAVDQSLWSEGRIAKYRESLAQSFAPPLAVLRVPRLGIEVPVLPGADERTMNRAIGHIPGTAAPGENGNVALVGHRDGFFRPLKDVALGDRIELETAAGARAYAVSSLEIVEPREVRVLAPSATPVLTLITCYPFYFVGQAPQRLIVRADELPAEGGEVRPVR